MVLIKRKILILMGEQPVSIRDSMEYYENRLKTFDTCPKQMLPDKIQ